MKRTLKYFLADTLTEEELSLVNRAFEIVGDIGIIELDEALVKHEKKIGEALLEVNKSLKTVLKKSGVHHGEFRTQDLVYVAGEEKYETIYQENGIRLVINPGTVYFSARLSTERAELMDRLEPNKRVLVMFSGAGPYTFTALRKQPNLSKIVSVEINPEGHKYALQSLELNKSILKKSDEFKRRVEELKSVGKYVNEKEILNKLVEDKVQFYNGDVREIVKNELKDEKFDVIYMPLPKDAELFLDSAFSVADKGCIVHMYDFVHENDFPHQSEDAVRAAAKKFGVEVEIVETRKVGQYSPRKYRVCCDFIVK